MLMATTATKFKPLQTIQRWHSHLKTEGIGESATDGEEGKLVVSAAELMRTKGQQCSAA